MHTKSTNKLFKLSITTTRKMHINYIPMRWGHGDNYSYILSDDASNDAWIIDPAEPATVLPKLKSDYSHLNFKAVVNTHHHYDHSGGNKKILDYFHNLYGSSIPLIAGKDSPYVESTPAHKAVLALGKNIKITALHTPCHTQDSICWYAVDDKTNEKALFSGDTLFHLGNGRFFEGTGAQMTKVIMETIPDNVDKKTKIYPGHEYTEDNSKFAKSVMPNNKALSDYIAAFNGKEFICGMFTLEDEQKANPFFRLSDPEIIEATNGMGKSQSQIMDTLRVMKNSF